MKKIYKYRTTVGLTVTFAIVSLLSVVMLIVGIVVGLKEFIYTGTFCVCGLLMVWIVLFAGKFWTPIYIDDKKIRHRSMELDWNEVRITACPCATNSMQYAYLLVFSNQYLTGKELKKALKENFYIQLTYKNLQTITEFYHHEIKITDRYEPNFETQLRSTKKINELFYRHNDKFNSNGQHID